MQSFLRQAGWPESLIVTMGAIGQAESSGNSTAHNDANPGRERSYGLWQVNINAHPEYSREQLFDPLFNAQAALGIYQVQGLRAWGPYQTGIYRQYLSASQSAYNAGGGVSPQDSSGGGDDTYGTPDQTSYSNVLGGANDPTSSPTLTPLLVIGLGGLLLYLIVD
jgi:hypothetical protein